MLSSRRIPKQIVFSAGKDLNDILGEFSNLFNLDEPSPEALDRYDRLVKAIGPNQDLLQDNHVHSYNERMRRLQTSTYVLERLRKATNN